MEPRSYYIPERTAGCRSQWNLAAPVFSRDIDVQETIGQWERHLSFPADRCKDTKARNTSMLITYFPVIRHMCRMTIPAECINGILNWKNSESGSISYWKGYPHALMR